MSTMAPEMLALQRLYHWEKPSPNRVAFTQPMGGGVVQDYTWSEVADQVRRMAHYLQTQGWEPGSRIAILSKNCAWWIMSDLAIWMAGHVSVPLYPTLAAGTIRQILVHSEASLLFVGKLDGWEGMQAGIPAGLACIAHPLAPDSAQEQCAAAGQPGASCRRTGHPDLHLGHDRFAQGRHAQLRQFLLGAGRGHPTLADGRR